MDYREFMAVYLVEKAKDAIESGEWEKAINLLVKAIMHLSESIQLPRPS